MPPSPRAPKLLDGVRQAIRVRHYSRRTEEAYVHWIRRFIVHHQKRHPRELCANDVSAFLSALASEHHVSASTQNQALSAVLFLYKHVLAAPLGQVDGIVRATTPPRLPVVLSRREVTLVTGLLDGVPWIVVSLLYGAGLRLLEALTLRVKDIDFERREVTVRQGKGRKDRRTMLPDTTRERLVNTSRQSGACTKPILLRGLGGWSFLTALIGSIPMLHVSGPGSLPFQQRASVMIRGGERPRATTCTNP